MNLGLRYRHISHGTGSFGTTIRNKKEDEEHSTEETPIAYYRLIDIVLINSNRQ